jgi:hypothetical protein
LHESVYPNVALAAGSNIIQINYAGLNRPVIRAGGWILDATLFDATGASDPHGSFYRVLSVADDPVAPSTLDIELQTPILQNSSVGVIIIMEGVAEVFEKGVGGT